MFSKRKFLSLSLKTQHKKAAMELRHYYEKKEEKYLLLYRKLEECLLLPLVDLAFPSLADRYHFHLKEASISLKEHNFLTPQYDSLAKAPYLPIGIYLENLRSGHNVGSILRTVEAFRLGTVYFSPETPGIANKKVTDAAMGSAPFVPSKVCPSFDMLPKPLIAVETVLNAPPYFDFSFPKRFSLLLGNEEYGLKSSTINKADYVIQIPLLGSKNSLNVASAFAIIAAEIRKQQAQS